VIYAQAVQRVVRDDGGRGARRGARDDVWGAGCRAHWLGCGVWSVECGV